MKEVDPDSLVEVDLDSLVGVDLDALVEVGLDSSEVVLGGHDSCLVPQADHGTDD